MKFSNQIDARSLAFGVAGFLCWFPILGAAFNSWEFAVAIFIGCIIISRNMSGNQIRSRAFIVGLLMPPATFFAGSFAWNISVKSIAQRHARSLQEKIFPGMTCEQLAGAIQADNKVDLVHVRGKNPACGMKDLREQGACDKDRECDTVAIKFYSTMFYSETFEVGLQDSKVVRVGEVKHADDF